MPSDTPTDRKVRRAFREVRSNPPSTLDRKKKGKAREAQIQAIALSKARQAGASIPRRRRPRGSEPFTDEEMDQGFRRL